MECASCVAALAHVEEFVVAQKVVGVVEIVVVVKIFVVEVVVVGVVEAAGVVGVVGIGAFGIFVVVVFLVVVGETCASVVHVVVVLKRAIVVGDELPVVSPTPSHDAAYTPHIA